MHIIGQENIFLLIKLEITAPKVKLLTQPMDVINSALFEGDMTRLLPKITYFLVQVFGFWLEKE